MCIRDRLWKHIDLSVQKLLEYLGNFLESRFINFKVSAMLFERLEEVNVLLALLFNSKISLPTLKDVIFNNVTKKKSNATVQSFIQFVDDIENYFSDIKIASSSCYSAFLSDAELNSDNDHACIHFFNMILNGEYLASEDIQLLTSRIFYIVRHDSIDVCRVEEVFQMLREA